MAIPGAGERVCEREAEAENIKARLGKNPVWPLSICVSATARDYLALVVDVVVMGGASLCAHALMLNAATARVMMAMILMYLNFPPFFAGCWRYIYEELFGQNNVNSCAGFPVNREYVRLRLYLDGSSFGDEIEKFGDIGIGHADATVGGGCAELVLVIGAVNVDVAVESVEVLGIEAVEPEDAGLDEVGGIGGVAGLAGENAGLEDGAEGSASADFF